MRFRVFVILLFATTVLGFSQQSSQDDNWFLGKPIRDIYFSGLKNISQSELNALMIPYKGRIFDDNVFLEIMGKLYALEYFDRIEPSTSRADATGSEVIIRFNVIERPIVSRINLVGNSGLRRNDILDVISTNVSDIFNQARIRVDIEAVINKYIEKGYPNASVSVEETQTGESSVVLTFRIVEGDKISISRIEFQGNTRFSSNTLRGRLSLKAKSLLNDGAFQEAKLLADRETIARYYHDRGYIDAVVRDVTRTYDSDGKGTNLLLTFMIDEGNEFRFGGMTFQGNSIFTTEQLSRLVSTKVGDIVNITKLEADLQSITDLYLENGYIFNSIIMTPEKDNQTSVLSYSVTIVERNRAYIENLIIIGNEKTKTEVILREIPLEPGDVFSKTKVMEALRNLYNLQYFSLVMPDTLPGSTENLMDLVFTVQEQMTTDIQFGLTFSGSADPDVFPISGLVEWNDRNIAGSGNEFGVKLSSSIVDTSSIALNYLHRWVFGLPLSLGVDFSADYLKRLASMQNPLIHFYGNEPSAFPAGFSSYDEYRSHNFLPSRDYLMTYEQWYLSFGLSSGYRWYTVWGNLSLSGGLRLGMINNFYDGNIFTPFDPTLREGNDEWVPKNSFWLSLSLDQRDIFYDPSSGYYLLERIGFYGFFNNEREHYFRSDTKAQYYLTLFNIPVTENWSFRSILAFHAGLSFLFKQPGRNVNDLKPIIEEGNMLAVDGMFTGRGWSEEFRNKGLMLFDSWIELRFPLMRGILAFDFFFDTAGVETEQGYYFGNNSEGNSNFTIDNLRFSFGGGVRFTIPQFPIRISIAKRFRFIDGKFNWVSGAIFGDSSNPASGVDLVISFALSY
ncbi:MAG: outer membrane protein assembly factor BamA [Treponema sp.]|jgi:outer membrane protein insertion porin family|nr:outer membrane protein assembly factor BamA [Treponema sp.]